MNKMTDHGSDSKHVAMITSAAFPVLYLKSPDIEAQDFPTTEEDLGIVVAIEEDWFKKFHNAIASDSVQQLLEAMASV